MSIVERFEKFALPEPNSGCWLWVGGFRPKDGYGNIKVSGKRWQAHRLAYELYCGPVQEGQQVMHSCDNTACVNPEHLSLGSNHDNVQDKVRKGRQAKGELIGISKLCEADVLSIRKSSGSQRSIAAAFGVSHTTIGDIKSRKLWAHVQ